MYTANVYRVLIASPSDLAEERIEAANAVTEWNVTHSEHEKMALLPVLWETHATPAYGDRPQEFINRELVDNCDIIVGLFWTKLGTSTGAARSGTEEEIVRAADAGKHIFLYFCKKPVPYDKIDTKQFDNLQEFKKTTYDKALHGTFASDGQLTKMLAQHLTTRARELGGFHEATALAEERSKRQRAETDLRLALQDVAFYRKAAGRWRRTFVESTVVEHLNLIWQGVDGPYCEACWDEDGDLSRLQKKDGKDGPYFQCIYKHKAQFVPKPNPRTLRALLAKKHKPFKQPK